MNIWHKLEVSLCALVAIYAGCRGAWWIMDSWIVTTVIALAMADQAEEIKNNAKPDNH